MKPLSIKIADGNLTGSNYFRKATKKEYQMAGSRNSKPDSMQASSMVYAVDLPWVN